MLTKTNNKQFFNCLQVFRGIAALMVVFHHQWVAFEQFYKSENSVLHFVALLGKNGVDFFFVLSGFIIAYSNFDKSEKTESIKSYLINRILRIYLPFLPVSIMMLTLYFLFPSVSEANRDLSTLTSLTLIPDGKPALSVSWTLIHEMMFYLLFLSWFISKRLWHSFIVFWSIIIVYLNYFSHDLSWTQRPFLEYFGSIYNLEFIIGFLCASLLKKVTFANNTRLILLGGIIFSTGVFLKWNAIHLFYSDINLIFSVSFALLILGSIGTKLNTINPKSLLMILGNASYSIYLVHNPLISILVRTFQKIPYNLSQFFVFVVIFIICCAAGVLYSQIFEDYLLKRFKNKLLPVPVNKRQPILVSLKKADS